MDIYEASELLENKMIEHGLSNWNFGFSNTQNRGDCNYTKKLIRLSRPFVKANGIERVLQTILHEIAHALTWINHRNAKPHGIEWQTIAKSIGHTGQRYMAAESYDTGRTRKDTEKVGTCPNCDRKMYARRRQNIACGKCCKQYNGGKYTTAYKIVWTEKAK